MVRTRSIFPALTLGVVLAQLAPAQAQEPTTRHARPAPEHRGDVFPPRFGRERLGTYDPGATIGQLNDQEREEVMRFMEKYSPRRAQRLKEVPEKRQEPILRRISAQYRALQRMKEEDPQVYQLRLNRLPIEDEMFNLGWQLNHDDDNTTKATTEELQSRLREQVRLFVESCLQERQTRMRRQAQRLKQEQQRLESERREIEGLIANKESLINEGVAAVEKERSGVLKDLVFPPRKVPRAPAATEPTATADRDETTAPQP